jgi:dTDP-4-amino-4,6-dideoxygalactose transaminase
LNIDGEVITTPYSFVATSHSLWWNNIKPVFVDIENKYGNIDVDKIEKAITEKTSAILAVHVYGNPCNVEEIDRIAKKHNLKVIYDAAHAFGVKYNNNSVLNFGDLSILSFHATKVFNTFEGGAIISHKKEDKEKIDLLKNFGIKDENTIVSIGINAKMNEFQSLIGILQLEEHYNRIIKRKKVFEFYNKIIKNSDVIRMILPLEQVEYNYAYLPILIQNNKRDYIYDILKENNYIVRKYFYPLISNIDLYKDLESSSKENLPVANDFANNVLCLPIYPDLELSIVKDIVNLIIDNINNHE